MADEIDYTPWKTERWLPGVLNKYQMEKLIDCGFISIPSDIKAEIGYSAMDLHLSDEVYKLKNGTIKPVSQESFRKVVSSPFYCEKYESESDGSFRLKKGESYIVKIKESFHPHTVKNSPIYAQATAKSTVGRLDVIARLIIDGMGEYEGMEPFNVSGDIYLEITPNTFNIEVKSGDSLSQIRFFCGKIEDCIIKGKFLNHILISENNKNREHESDGTLSVDITDDKEVKAAAFMADMDSEKVKNEFIKINPGDNKYDPKEYWKLISQDVSPTIHSLPIMVDKFYILRSKERISLPKGVAVYCKAMDETIGELRIHYAGFVHPLFGFKRGDDKFGTPLIFEVRGHNLKVNLTDGEKLARLTFYRMSMDAASGQSEKEDYNNQELNLSKIFKSWNS